MKVIAMRPMETVVRHDGCRRSGDMRLHQVSDLLRRQPSFTLLHRRQLVHNARVLVSETKEILQYGRRIARQERVVYVECHIIDLV